MTTITAATVDRIVETTPSSNLLRLARTDAEKELLYYLDNNVSRYLGDILQHSSGDDSNALRYKNIRQLHTMAADMVDRGLVIENQDGTYRRSDFAIDMDSVREMAFKALLMVQTISKHLRLLKQQTPEFERVQSALDAAENLAVNVRSMIHSFE